MPKRFPAACTAAALLVTATTGVSGSGYMKPPAAIQQVLDAKPTPQVSVSPAGDRMLLMDWVRYPPIADLARPMLRLAGQRIDPATHGPHEPRRIVGYRIKLIPGPDATSVPDTELPVRLPADAALSAPAWSPDGKRFAFTNTRRDGIELWVADALTGSAKAVSGLKINAVSGVPFQWMPDGRTLLCQAVVSGPPPAPELAPEGPAIQETDAKAAPVLTYQDLLRNPRDEKLWDYYATSRLAVVDPGKSRITPVGAPGIFSLVFPSPDAKHILVDRLHRPYSYLVGSWAFPTRVEVWDASGRVEHTLADLPLADQVPNGGVLPGPRDYTWIPTEPSTLIWAEALDGGDPKQKVEHRDRVLTLPAPFKSAPKELARTQHRFTGISFTANGKSALLSEYDRDRLWTRTFILDPAQPGAAPRLLWDRSVNDRYGNPGAPILKTLPNGHDALRCSGEWIYLIGTGASPKGDRPFLDRLNLASLKSERLHQCPDQMYETVASVLDDAAQRFITRAETPQDPPNYVLHRQGRKEDLPLTRFPDPAPQLRGIKKQLVTYTRADGVPLSFTLYLPPGYKEGERLPTLVWAYPQEFGDAGTAGQVSGSPYRFTTMAGISHLFMLLQGYAILDGAAMPVVGPPQTANDTFVEQIVSSAKAAIDKASALGVTDPDRVAVGGHSYGAFMTANLLAHSQLFRAGIARSGAYNRSLTPFGFQSERRTFWEAPEIYVRLSPFRYADQIKTPLLLIHGEADNNPGTFPIQSERLYQAIKGNGGTARFVSLPFESHGYAARESVEHTLYEMTAWLDRYVKPIK